MVRIQGWSSKMLSRTGKAILIKSVAQTIPSSYMLCFLHPKSLCQDIDIEKMMNEFWWSSNSTNNKGIRWLSWDKMSLARNEGGMGFHILYGFNMDLLEKHCWNFLNNLNSLVSRVFKPSISLIRVLFNLLEKVGRATFG